MRALLAQPCAHHPHLPLVPGELASCSPGAAFLSCLSPDSTAHPIVESGVEQLPTYPHLTPKVWKAGQPCATRLASTSRDPEREAAPARVCSFPQRSFNSVSDLLQY